MLPANPHRTTETRRAAPTPTRPPTSACEELGYKDTLPKGFLSIVVDWDAAAGCLVASDTSPTRDAE
jgi:hypothetical protein